MKERWWQLFELVLEERRRVANEWPAINNSSSGGVIERVERHTTGIGTTRLQRTRAITRNTHPMLDRGMRARSGRAMITNFRDAFVLRDAR